MSVCFETANVLASQVSTSSSSQLLEETSTITQSSSSANIIQTPVSANIIQPPISSNTIQVGHDKLEQQVSTTKSIAKLVVANHPSANSCNPVLQKVVNPPLITVLNPSGPLTVVKTLCVTSGASSAPQFTLVNSSPLNVTNAVGKSPTITLLNAPVTVVKAITTQNVDKTATDIVPNSAGISSNTSPVPAIIENRGHNVFVKNTCPDSTVPDIPQSHKLLTANNFPQTNVLTNLNSTAKTVNGQRNKLKILSNVVMPGTSQAASNILLNKTNTQRYVPRQKIIGPNGATTKYLNKPPPNNIMKPSVNTNLKQVQDKSPTRMVYPTHKSQIKTIPPMNNFIQKSQQGIKTLSPQHKNIPGQVQRTGSGLRTIPPQRPQKIANKPNYIGKHAVQAQKMRQTHGKMKGIKVPSNVPYNIHGPQMPDKQLTELTFNQALTAQIIETLSNTSTPLPSNRYEILPARYDNAFSCPDTKQPIESCKQSEDKTKSGLDALSLICQAVLLDHNYNATLPPDSPARPSLPSNTQNQINGITANSIYSPGTGKRRSLPTSNTISSTSSLSNISMTPSNSNSLRTVQDDDAASDISDGSERKHDTEGEETDTAPEAEAVNNDNHFDGYGDYVTRCICGFLHDDGYMVECDRCKVWQHVQCVVKNRQVPDEYLCEVCDPTKPIDRHKARMIQQQWLRDRQFTDPKLRKYPKIKEVFKPKETISDSDSSDGEHIAHHNNNVVSKGRALTNRRKSDAHPKQNTTRQRRDSAKEVVQRRQKRKERKIVRRKTKPQTKSHSDDENQDTWASHLPQLRQWIEKYEEAVTNHYSPELRARISSIRINGVQSDLSTQFDCTVHKCRVHTQPLTEIKYLVSTVHLTPNTPIVELRGKYMLSTQHRNSGGSLTTRQHSQRPGPFLFFYRLHKDNTEVCVDTRTYGNSARFIRRSCRPNAELRHCIEKGVLHLYIVSITTVEKNRELTIKHESHDLAAIGTTQIACACGNAEDCTVNKSTVKKNGESSELHRKRRGRRTISSSLPEPEPVKVVKEEPQPIPIPLPPAPVPVPVAPVPPSPVKQEKPSEEVVKKEIVKKEDIQVKLEVKEEEELVAEIKVKEEVKEEIEETIKEEPVEEKPQEVKKEKVKEEEEKSPPPTPISTRRSSLHYKSDKEEDKSIDIKEEKVKCKKLSREERKLEAILRAIEQMEKAESRKQEHQAKQAHRRESEPGPTPKEEEKQEPKLKRRRRKGRARTTSQSARRNRLNSTDSYMTSGDENMLSPNDGNHPPNRPTLKELGSDQSDNKAVGLLLALSNGDSTNKCEKSPTREVDSNSNSAHSSPETPLSSACLLVQAAVEPLEPGFKFPKTKKGLMNEWLNKVPEPVQSASSISPSSLTPHLSGNSEFEPNSGFYTPAKNLATLAQAVSYCDTNIQPRGSAKKRWLRQAISEDHSCDSPASRPDSPPLSDMVAPPKKRRLPRESLSNDTSPPTTPTSLAPPTIINKPDKDTPNQEGCVEIVYSGTDGDSPTQTLESDAILKERAAKMKQEFSKCIVPSTQEGPRNEMGPLGCLMDPRLTRDGHMFSNNDLVGTVEKTLSILGFENSKPEITTLPKRKLSITEYRQRKKLNNNDKSEEHEQEPEHTSTEENNSSESFKVTSRLRSGSTSSSTSLTSSDDEMPPSDITAKVPAFNSEPTELERQREISSIRLKKAFGLAVDEEPRPALNVEAILNLELEPKVKPIPIPSPTFPIPGSCEVTREVVTPKPCLSPDRSISPPVLSPTKSRSPSVDVDVEEESAVDDVAHKEENKEDVQPNMFYTPDEEEGIHPDPVYEESNSVNYVPPFNNPVYPNSSFTAYASTIDALYNMQQYFQAENLYRQALQMRKNILIKKTANNKITENQKDIASDVDIKYKIHLCCLALKQKKAAVEILQMITARLRTPKINMALGNIYKELGMERPAIACFKEVLRECPLALEAVENLLKLGIKGVEVNSLMVEVSSEITWLSSWIKAQAQLYSRDFENAIKTYKSMDTHGLLKDNTSLLVNMGYCYHYMGENHRAISVLQKAIRIDPFLTTGRDLLSTLLAASSNKEHIRTLESLTPTMDMSLWSSEHWVVLGNYMYALKKYDKAAYFGQQACLLDRRNVEALLLKANTLLQIKKYQDAASHCTEALQICPYRYDLHKCLVECYIQTNRLREADSMAMNACKQLNFSAQGYCLHASVLLKDPMASSKTVRRTLEKAVSQDRNGLTNALCMLVEFLEQEQQYEQASQLLIKHIETQKPSSRLHQLLGDCFVNLQKDDEAFHHYTIALKLDPTNQRATEGLNNIGRSLSLSKRDSYYTCVAGETSYTSQGTNSSDHEVDPESDTDPWPASADIGSFE